MVSVRCGGWDEQYGGLLSQHTTKSTMPHPLYAFCLVSVSYFALLMLFFYFHQTVQTSALVSALVSAVLRC